MNKKNETRSYFYHSDYNKMKIEKIKFKQKKKLSIEIAWR